MAQTPCKGRALGHTEGKMEEKGRGGLWDSGGIQLQSLLFQRRGLRLCSRDRRADLHKTWVGAYKLLGSECRDGVGLTMVFFFFWDTGKRGLEPRAGASGTTHSLCISPGKWWQGLHQGRSSGDRAWGLDDGVSEIKQWPTLWFGGRRRSLDNSVFAWEVKRVAEVQIWRIDRFRVFGDKI